MSAALSAPTLAHAHVGAMVVDARTGSVLFRQNADDAFQPASTMKLLVGSAVLSLLGPDATLETSISTDGSIENGALRGNIYVQGGGDPSIDDAAFSDAARTLAAQHVTRIDGAIVIDNTRFTAPPYPDGWTVDDLPNDYAAPITALSYDENAVTVRVAAARTAGAPGTIALDPLSDALSIENRTVTGPRGSMDSTQLGWPPNVANAIEVTGNVPMAASDPIELGAAVRDPASFAGNALLHAFSDARIEAGGQIREGGTPPSARVLWRRSSPAMRDLVARMWLPSDNFVAETLLEDLAANDDGPSDTRVRGIARETQWMQTLGIDSAGVTIVDASGVSQYDRLSVAALVAMLRGDWSGPDRDAILAALPVSGRSGTLQHVFAGTPLEGIVHAKTGTMRHTRTLAGYLIPPQGDPLIFALLVNDWMDGSAGASTAVRAVEEHFLEAALTPGS